MPVEALVDGCPLYDLSPERAGGLDLREPGDARRPRADRGGRGADPADPALSCSPCSPRRTSPPSAGPLSSTTRWSARARRGGRSRRTPPSSRSPRSDRAIAVAIDGNGRRVACDPFIGTIEAVLECTQNLACVGAEPLGLTNCLNFGNPEKPCRPGSWTGRSAGWPTPATRWAFRWWAATSPSTTRVRKGRSTRRRSSAWSASCPTPAAPPAALSPVRATRSRCSGRSRPSLAGSELAKLRGELRLGLPEPLVDRVADACRGGSRGGTRRAPLLGP